MFSYHLSLIWSSHLIAEQKHKTKHPNWSFHRCWGISRVSALQSSEDETGVWLKWNIYELSMFCSITLFFLLTFNRFQILGQPKGSFGFFYVTEEPKWTYWPTQYIKQIENFISLFCFKNNLLFIISNLEKICSIILSLGSFLECPQMWNVSLFYLLQYFG